MWIGERKIKSIIDQPDGSVNVSFKDSHEININKELLKVIRTKKKGKGLVTDVTRHVLATKFLMEMAEYDLDFGMVEHIAQGMHTLAHNMREDLFSKSFDCAGANNIKLKKLIGNYEEETKEDSDLPGA